MANTMTLIQSLTSLDGQSSADFTSIPQTYTDLYILVCARGNGYNGTDLNIKFNGSSSGYSGRLVWKDGNTTALTSVAIGNTSGYAGIIPGAQAGTNAYGTQKIYISSYTSGTGKRASTEFTTERNGVDTWIGYGEVISSVSAAITSISLIPSANFLGSSTAYLYGIADFNK
jgi:hypothetical protein